MVCRLLAISAPRVHRPLRLASSQSTKSVRPSRRAAMRWASTSPCHFGEGTFSGWRDRSSDIQQRQINNWTRRRSITLLAVLTRRSPRCNSLALLDFRPDLRFGGRWWPTPPWRPTSLRDRRRPSRRPPGARKWGTAPRSETPDVLISNRGNSYALICNCMVRVKDRRSRGLPQAGRPTPVGDAPVH